MITFILIYILCGCLLTVVYGATTSDKTKDEVAVETATMFFLWWLVLILYIAKYSRKLGELIRNKRSKNRG